MSQVAPSGEELICIAKIARPQGIRGEVIADLLTDFPDRFAGLDAVRVRYASGELVMLKLEGARLHKGRILLKFAGFDDMNAAQQLRGASVMVAREQLVELPEETWYDFDLIDCEAVTQDGATLGRVASVQRFGAAPLLAVRGPGGNEILIPFVSSICVEIDTARKRIVVDPPDGLLDL